MLANVLQKADWYISALERRLVEKRAIYSMHIPRTQSSICSHGVRSGVIAGLWNA